MSVFYRGRNVDPISLWSNYVEFPANWNPRPDDEFSPLVTCPNPDHQTTKRHFQINLTQPTVHCFAHCGISGDYESAIAKIEGVTHRAARKSILKHSRIGSPGVRVKRASAATKLVPEVDLSFDRYLPQSALEFLSIRNITSASVAAWELGWDADALRVVIPVKDSRGRVRTLIKRTVKPHVEPRYLYTDGVPRNSLLYGICNIDLQMVRSTGIVLVEGSIDTIINHQNGLRTTLGILGSKLSEIQAQMIAKLRPACIYTMFDADGAGISATISAIRLLKSHPIKVVRYPKGKTDPAVLTEREAGRAIERAISVQRFVAMTGVDIRPKHRKDFKVG